MDNIGEKKSKVYNPSQYWEAVNRSRKPTNELIQIYHNLADLQENATNELKQRRDQLEWMRTTFKEYGWSSVLDAGCGPGFWFQLWAELGLSATGIDLSPTAIPLALKMAESLGENYHSECVSLSNLPYDDNQFDVAVTVKVLLHVPPEEIQRSMRELARVSRYLMLIEFYSPNSVKTREHVFNHNYFDLSKTIGLETIKADRYPGQQCFFLLKSADLNPVIK